MASSSSSSPELSGALTASSSQEYASVQYSDLSREEVLEDLSSRFILNLPEEELASVERVCFQVEQAHWYYEDFVREQNPSKFPSYTLKTFSEALFHACPLLAHWAEDHDKTFASFMQYKTRVPVCGAIMLNDTWDKCVLVKGWKSSAGWGFPKGKINEQEPKHRCAIREVLEETGYNLENQLDPENVIQLSIKQQSISLYIVPGVPEDFPFETRTRKEISKIAWFRLSDLPTWKRNKPVPGKFYLISPFIGPLKAFIHDRKPRNLRRKAPRTQIPQVPGEAHASSEEDGAASVEGSPSSLVDSNTQELSSQSSCADHGEPHTPSPQYSAARVHQATFDAGDNASVENPIANALNSESLDPHLTNLLSCLTRSAASLSISEPAKAGFASAEEMSILPSVAPSSQRSFNDPTVSPDWSAHVPPQWSSNFQHEPPSYAASSPAIAARSPERTPMQTAVFDGAPSTSPVLKESGHGRRGSKSQADLSPYLSRPKGITKEMKYISMLESVAQESDRVASRMGHHAPIPSQRDLSTYPPAPPPSVPPEMIYSSGAPAHLPQQAPYPPPPLNGMFMRPSTSLALHHPPHPSTVPRQSMNEAQLRSLLPINGSWAHAPAASALPGAPFSPHVPTPMHTHRVAPPPRPLYTPTIASIPPHVAHANNARLLSILNSPNPVFRA